MLAHGIPHRCIFPQSGSRRFIVHTSCSFQLRCIDGFLLTGRLGSAVASRYRGRSDLGAESCFAFQG